MYTCMCVYIYIYRERERRRKVSTTTWMRRGNWPVDRMPTYKFHNRVQSHEAVEKWDLRPSICFFAN